MTIRSMVKDFLDKTTDARFRRDGQGRLVFFPMGFGAGRIVPDTATEAALRLGCRRHMIALLSVVIPILSVLNSFCQLKGFGFLIFFAGCVAAGFASQLYPLWLSRGLARSEERLSYPGAILGSLDRFGKKFLVFGLATSGIMAAASVFMLAYQPALAEADPVAMTTALLVFAPMTVVYAIALVRRSNAAAS
jgi:hypothetical protein